MKAGSAATQNAVGSLIAQAFGEGSQAKVEIQTAVLRLPEQFASIEAFAALCARSLRSSIPPPEVADLFEIVRDPAELPKAMFRATPGRGLAPYAVPYVADRQGVTNVQTALYDALLDSGDRLLVRSRTGLGKTREVAELAVRLCDEGWTVCVGKGQGDARMNAPVSFPDDLRHSRLLFVLEDLHQRVEANAGAQEPYIERLNAFVNFFESKMAPGEMYVIATARTEPHHQKHLGFDPADPLWRRFKVYDLPEFTEYELEHMLLQGAAAAGVQVDGTEARRMVSDSDKTPRTLVLNIERAKRLGERLTPDQWQPTQGHSWTARFREARGRWPAADAVYQALRLIREARFSLRSAYVTKLAGQLSHGDASSAVEGLVSIGLLSLYGGQLSFFSDDQLVDGLNAAGTDLLELETRQDQVLDGILAAIAAEPPLSKDLFNSMLILMLSGELAEAETIATRAIAAGVDTSDVYLGRGMAHADLNKPAKAEADYSAAIVRGDDDGFVYYQRAKVRSKLGDYAGAEADFTAAIARGGDDAGVYLERGIVRISQGNDMEAEADFTDCINRGQHESRAYLGRGAARFNQRDYARAEEDFTEAIRHGQDVSYVYFRRAGARFVRDDYAGAEADLTAAILRGQNDGSVYYLRGSVRGALANYAAMESDFADAIARGEDSPDLYAMRGRARFNQGDYSAAEADMTAAMTLGGNQADLHHVRGLARFNQGDYTGAEADYTSAIKLGEDSAGIYIDRARVRFLQRDYAGIEADLSEAVTRGENVVHYWMRAMIRHVQNDYAGAEADITAVMARGRDDADAHYWRGLARGHLDDNAGAEADFTAAIARGRDDAAVFYERGQVRAFQGNHADAEADLTAAIARGQDDAVVYYVRGRIRASLQNADGAEADFTAAIARGTHDGDIYHYRGRARISQYDLPGAEADFTAAIVRGEDDAHVYYARGLARLNQGNYADAASDLAASISRGQDDAVVYYGLGLARMTQNNPGQYANAEADFTAAIARGQNDAAVYQSRAYLAIRLKHLEQARQDCERAAALAPDDPTTHGRSGDLLLAFDDYSGAIGQYEAALGAASGTGWYFEPGLALLLAGRWKEAQDMYDRGSIDAPKSELKAALDELEFWTAWKADRVMSPEAQSTVAEIRDRLNSPTEAANE